METSQLKAFHSPKRNVSNDLGFSSQVEDNPVCLDRRNFGISTGPDGSVYIGEHRETERDGRGIVLYEKGLCFCGLFKRGFFSKGFHVNHEKCIIFKDGNYDRENNLKSKQIEVINRSIKRMFLLLSTFLSSPRLSGNFSIFSTRNWYDFSNTPHQIVSQLLLSPSSERERNQVDKESVIPLRPKDNNGMRNDDLREEVAHTSSPEAVFACAGPVATEYFSVHSFTKRFLIFLFPLFALPGLFCSPCAIDSTNTEREFIVSGASLQRSFDSPSLSLYASSFALLCEATALLIFFVFHNETQSLYNTHITVVEIFLPALLWIINAFVGGSYFGFRRSPHGLERMNRELTAELTALAANLVDSKSEICIYTWDETGRDKVKNKRYRLKWFLLSLLVACLHGGSIPLLRTLLGFTVIHAHPEVVCMLVLMSVSMACYVFVITYYVLKGVDMQREQRSKLAVLTKIAYVERKCLLVPGTYIKDHFCCDEPLNISDLKSGFPGWYTTRSLVLCASPCANHFSRGAAVSVLMLVMFLFSALDISYHIYKNFYIPRSEYTFVLGYDFIILFTWGPICIQYLTVCSSVRFELLRHLYIMDVSGLIQRLKNHNPEASSIVHKCRDIAASHDTFPAFFNIPLHPFINWFLIVWILLAMLLSFTTGILVLTGYV